MYKFLDDIFLALYGENTDEYGEKYSNVYQYECKTLINDLNDFMNDMIGVFLIDYEDIEKFIVIAEQSNIGNSLSIDYNKLEEVAKKIEEFYKNTK